MRLPREITDIIMTPAQPTIDEDIELNVNGKPNYDIRWRCGKSVMLVTNSFHINHKIH